MNCLFVDENGIGTECSCHSNVYCGSTVNGRPPVRRVGVDFYFDSTSVNMFEEIDGEEAVPCPYCERPLGKAEKGLRWCVHCHMWMRADGKKMTIGQVKELMRDAKDFD